MWLLDKDDNLIEKIKLINGVHSMAINGANTIAFECLNKVNKYDRLIYRDEMLLWHEFIVQKVTESKHTVSVFAENSSYELYANYIKDKRPNGTTNQHLDIILEDTRFKKGTVEIGGTVSLSYYYLSRYESLQKLCREVGGELQFRIEVNKNKITNRYVDLKMKLGHDIGKRFVYTKDLIGVTRTVLEDEIYTALIGRGRGEEIGDGFGRRITFAELSKPDSPVGEEYVSDEIARETWGILHNGQRMHRYGIVEFDDVDDVELLYDLTKEKLQSFKEPKFNYECDVTILNNPHENVSLGDTVLIVDNDFNGEQLRLKGRVIQFEKDLTNHSHSTVIIGNYISDLTNQTVELQSYINNFRSKSSVWDRSNAFDEDNKIDGSYVKELLKSWNDSINSTGGFVYAQEGQGILAYDKPIDENPTKVTQLVGGALRIANSKLPNGDWNWRTVLTGDGLSGEEILAETITVSKVSSDFGKNLDISSNESIRLSVQSSKEYTNDKISEIELTPGPKGVPGKDGTTTYTWVKYADTPTTGMSDFPNDKKYIGLAFNKDTATESTSYIDYEWSLMPQNITVGGRNLIYKALFEPNTFTETKESIASGWASTLIANDRTLAILESEVEYTISFDMELVERTDVPTLFSYQAGILLYSPAGDGNVRFFNSNLKALGDKSRVEITFITPTLTDHRFIFYTNRYTTDGSSPIGLDEVKFSNLKLEKGNVSTDWTPAPEDIEAEIDDLNNNLAEVRTETTTNTSNIEMLPGSIMDSVTENFTSIGALDEYKQQVSTQFTQTARDYEFLFSQVEEYVTTLDGETQQAFQEFKKYIRFVNGEIHLGNNTEPLELRIKNNRIAFLQNGNEVAYFSNNKFYVMDGHFINSLRIGNFEFRPRDNGSLSFGKVSE